MDVRIGVIQSPREITLEVADDTDRAALKGQIEAALSGAVDTLWVTDKKGREVALPGGKIAFVEFGSPESARKIGFGD